MEEENRGVDIADHISAESQSKIMDSMVVLEYVHMATTTHIKSKDLIITTAYQHLYVVEHCLYRCTYRNPAIQVIAGGT